MIKIFDANERVFSTAGNIIIEPLKCLEFKKKSLNGWYIDVEVSIKYLEYIEKDKLCVIRSKSKINPQAFRIGENIKKTSTKIKFQAYHVMFDASKYFLLDVRPTNMNGINTLNYINQRTDNVSPFRFFSNVENIGTAYFIRKNLLEAWEVIEERLNGVFEADNWDIYFLQSIGNDNGETIIYGKNAQYIEAFEDWSNVVTRLYPEGYDGIGLPEKKVEADINYNVPYTKTIYFSTILEDDERTQENLINELRINARKYVEENKYPKVSYTITSNINNQMEIGDIIHVLHPIAEFKTEVLEYEYDVITKKVKNLTFGNYSRDVKRKFDNIKNTINQLNNNLSHQQAVMQEQSDIINSLNKNGYVYIDDNEILILDTIPKENAENVWRFGLGGIGFSSNGYEGPFETAITMDGQINAKFITTGTMSVSRIEGLANRIGEYDRQISAISIDVEQLKSQIEEIADVTTTEDGYGTITIDNVNESEPILLKIRPSGEDVLPLRPKVGLHPRAELKPHSREIIFKRINESQGEEHYEIEYNIPNDLYKLGDTYDEFILDYTNQQCYITHRIGINSNGEKYVLEIPTTEYLDYPTIPLLTGDYEIYTPAFATAYIYARLMAKNLYTDQFATKVELNSSITETKNEINQNVNQKFTNYKTAQETDAAINIRADQITENVSKTYTTKEYTERLEGRITVNEGAIEQVVESSKTNAKNLVSEYYLSTSKTQLSGGSWSETAPVWQQNKYMWTRTKITLENGSMQYSNPVCIAGAKGDTGAKGDKGDNGERGIPGVNGENGQTSYLHIAYANNSTGTSGFSTTDSTNKLFIGQYTDFTELDSTNPSKYSWSKIKGETGAKGDTGVGVSSIIAEYYISTSPSTQTGGSWSTAEPTFDENTYIWVRYKTTYTNNTVVYSTPQISYTNNIKGKLELKLDKDDTTGQIISMINASATNVKINGNKINIKGQAVEFETEINASIASFTFEDVLRVDDIIHSIITPTTSDYAKYDLNGDGVIDSTDFIEIFFLYLMGQNVNFNGTFKINPYSAKETIQIYNNLTDEIYVTISPILNYFKQLQIGEQLLISNQGNLDKYSRILPGMIVTDDGKISAGRSLYENESGTTGSVSLSESVDNFTYIEIYYKTGTSHGCQRIYSPNGKRIFLNGVSVGTTLGLENFELNCAKYDITSTMIQLYMGGSAVLMNNHYPSLYTYNVLHITKVIGYR